MTYSIDAKLLKKLKDYVNADEAVKLSMELEQLDAQIDMVMIQRIGNFLARGTYSEVLGLITDLQNIINKDTQK